jgi:APA family basic amino acid/polyamine antiporter
MTADERNYKATPAPATQLGLWDAVSLVVGIVVGTSIFRASPQVFQNTAGPWHAMGAWLLGGGLSLVGALCYAELATTYTRSGGDYEYLTRSFGRWAGFLFGWTQLTAVLTASIGTMAYAFADYGVRLANLSPYSAVWLAAAAILAVTLANAYGAVVGKTLQNVFTTAKVVGLAGVVIVGIGAGRWASFSMESPIPPLAPLHHGGSATFEGGESLSFGLAMVFVLYAYGGWNDAAFVAAEVRDRRRNLPLALIGGVAAITVIYLAVNAAYIAVLGFDEARRAKTPAAEVMAAAMGSVGAQAVSALVMISALGAINGMVLAGSRVYAVAGADHRALRWLSGWDQRKGVPRAALAAQAAVALAMVFAVGLRKGASGFETLLAATAPVFWSFLFATGLSLIVLRLRDPERERPFAVPLFPLPPLVFCATCAFMLKSSLEYARWLALLGAAPVAVGFIIYAATLQYADRQIPRS